jgi:hypothetical protein
MKMDSDVCNNQKQRLSSRYILVYSLTSVTRITDCRMPNVYFKCLFLQIFEVELKKKVQEITLTFDRPQSLSTSKGEKVTQYWTLT